MSSHGINLNPGFPLEESFNAMPDTFRAFLATGFRNLAQQPPEQHQRIVALIKDSFIGGGPSRQDAPQLGLSVSDTSALVGAGGVLAIALVLREDAPKTFIEAAIKSSVVERSQEANLLLLSEAIKSQANEVRETWERFQLVSEVLPALTRVDTTVDLRFAFNDDTISYSVPLLLVHLDTDQYGQEVFFQLTLPQLESLIKDLTGSLAKMRALENWKGTKRK